jgi:hypothetical protein
MKSIYFLLLIFLSCNYNSKSDYKNLVLKRFDLKGNVKSLQTNINFINTIFDCCDLRLFEIVTNDFKVIKFTDAGIIESVEHNTNIEYYDEISSQNVNKPVIIFEKYDKNGDVQSTSIVDENGKEIGFTNFLYYKNQYHKNNLFYDVDSSKLFLDTLLVIEKGTKNKSYNGVFGVDFGINIELKKVYNKDAFMLEQMSRNIEGGLIKYIYDKKHRLKNKIRIYDNMIMDSIFFNYDKNGYLVNTYNKAFKFRNSFYFDKFDQYGNWLSLLIVNGKNKVEVIRKIEYY